MYNYNDDIGSSSEKSRTLHINEKWLIFFTLLTVLTIIALVLAILGFVNDTSSMNSNSSRGGSGVETYILKYEPSVGSLPETAVVNTYVTRYLNKLTKNSGHLGVSLANNQFTMVAGTWTINAAAPVYRAGANLIRLYNVTDDIVETQGQSSFSNTTGGGGQSDQCIAVLSHTWTLTKKVTYEIQHYVSAVNGQDFTFGNPIAKSTGANLDSEVYTECTINRI